MSTHLLNFDFLKAHGRPAFFLFPALFIIALLFPPLLFLLPAVLFSILILFAEVPSLVLPRALCSSVRLPGRRSPPLGV